MISRVDFHPHRDLLDTVCNYLGTQKAAYDVELTFPDGSIISCDWDLKKQTNMQEVGINASTKDAFMRMEEALVKMRLKKGTEVITRDLRVHHSLLTDSHVYFERECGNANGVDASGERIFYPEASFTAYGVPHRIGNVSKDDKDREPALIRPVYNYILDGVDQNADAWDVYGPSPLLYEFIQIATVDMKAQINGKEVDLSLPIFGKGEYRKNDVDTGNEDNPPRSDKALMKVRLSDGSVTVPFTYACSLPGLEGAPILASEYISILRLVTSFDYYGSTDSKKEELAASIGVSYANGVLTIPCESFNGRTRVRRDVADKAELQFGDSLFVKTYFPRFTAADTAFGEDTQISIKVNNGSIIFYNLDYDPFVTALIGYFFNQYVTNWCGLLVIPQALLSAGLFKLDKNAVGASGTTREAKEDSPKTVKEYDPLRASEQLTLHRCNYGAVEELKEGAYAIAGYSLANDKESANGIVDHYFVVQKDYGRLRAITPTHAGFRIGDDVTDDFSKIDNVEYAIATLEE